MSQAHVLVDIVPFLNANLFPSGTTPARKRLEQRPWPSRTGKHQIRPIHTRHVPKAEEGAALRSASSGQLWCHPHCTSRESSDQCGRCKSPAPVAQTAARPLCASARMLQSKPKTSGTEGTFIWPLLYPFCEIAAAFQISRCPSKSNATCT